VTTALLAAGRERARSDAHSVCKSAARRVRRRCAAGQPRGPRLLNDLARAVPDAAVLAGLALALHRQPPAHHVQRVRRAHAHDSRARARRQPQQRRHLPVPAVLLQVGRDAPAAGARAQVSSGSLAGKGAAAPAAAAATRLLSCSYVRNFTAELGTIRTTLVQFPARGAALCAAAGTGGRPHKEAGAKQGMVSHAWHSEPAYTGGRAPLNMDTMPSVLYMCIKPCAAPAMGSQR